MAAGALALPALAVGAGCGGEDESRDDPREIARIEATIAQVQAAFEAGRYGRVCDLVTSAASLHVGLGAHGRGGACYGDVLRLSTWVRGERKQLDPPQPKVVSVDVDDEDDTRAMATLSFGDGRTASAPMRKQRGRWRLNGFYGGVPAERQKSKF